MTNVIDRLAKWLFLAIFLVFPFQKKNKIFRSFAKSIIPEDAQFPDFFSTSIYYYFTDILILCFAGLCIYRYRHKLYEFFFYGPAKWLTLLTGIALLSIVQSTTPTYPLHYIRLFQLFLGVLFFCSSMAYIRTQNREKLLFQVFWVICLTGVFESAIAIAQYFSQDSIGLKWLGEGGIRTFGFAMATGDRWIFDTLFKISTGQTFLLRACGTLAHPNILGGFIFFSLMMTFYLFLVEKKRRRFIFLQIAIFIHVFALCVSFSRSAIFATGLSSLIWGSVILYQHYIVRKNLVIRRFFQLISVVSVSSLICLTVFYSQFFCRGGIVGYNSQAQGADTERIVYQNIAWDMFKESPLLGVGFNHFQLELQKNFSSFSLFSKVHNIYLLVLVEMGILGFIAFLLFIFSIIRTTFLMEKNLLNVLIISLFIGVLFIGGCDFYLIEGQQARILFFGVASFCLMQSKKSLALIGFAK